MVITAAMTATTPTTAVRMITTAAGTAIIMAMPRSTGAEPTTTPADTPMILSPEGAGAATTARETNTSATQGPTTAVVPKMHLLPPTADNPAKGHKGDGGHSAGKRKNREGGAP